MTPLFWTVFILFIMIIFLFLSNLYYLFNIQQENWQDYMTLPFGYLSTGSNPLDAYRKDLYREPYMWPQTFYQSYPVPSVQPYPLL